MSTDSPETLTVFRGQKGLARKKLLISFCAKILNSDIGRLLSVWERAYLHVVKHKGRLTAAKQAKTWYDFSLRWSCQASPTPLAFTKTDKDGFPKFLSEFKPYLSLSNPDRCRAALTVLQLYKLDIVKGEYSLESITRPYTGEELPKWLPLFDAVASSAFAADKIRWENDLRRREGLQAGFHISGKNGPNGPALGSAFVDREAIRGTNLESQIKELGSLTGNFRLCGLIAGTGSPSVVTHKSGRVPEHSVIRIKYESGGKVRPFAICDFFSQSALKILHDFLMERLKRNRCDGTNDHFKASLDVRKWTSVPNSKFWSYDLTSATDRFPVFLQERAMKHLFGDKIGSLWRSIICDREFTGPRGEKVKWAVGQPLGALSSWAAFATTHHLIVQVAYLNAYPIKAKKVLEGKRIRPFRGYRIIGDDITIAGDRRVAEEYRKILDDLGVEISQPKCFTPEMCKYPTAELAKRVQIQGIEITPVPPDTILLREQNSVGILNLLEDATNRGYTSACSPYPVQSLGLSRAEWATLTFPLVDRLRQFNGLQTIVDRWDRSGSPPAGLDPGWFTWVDHPREGIKNATVEFIYNGVADASRQTDQYVQLLWNRMADLQYIEKGGDWQPESPKSQNMILAEPLQQCIDELAKADFELSELVWGDEFSWDKLRRFIGRLSKFLNPAEIIRGRKAKDEKTFTTGYTSKLIRRILSISLEELERTYS
nr:MAG: RNA-dependent RNA polymerase [Hangzhou mito-like virus 2]